jgi:pimeloyl-ACP methyl ester carboxylesterase
METAIKSVVLPSGVRLPYVEQGGRAGVPVVFLHGTSDSWRSFENVLPELPDWMRAIAVTQRGHGDADRPATGYRTQDFADDVAALMDALGLEKAFIVGHSMGGSIAQRFAIDHPARMLGLVLIGARASWHRHPGVLALGEAVATLSDPVDPDFVREFQLSTLARPISPAYLETVVAESLKLPARVWRAAFAECVFQADHTAELGSIATPTLLMCGGQDDFARDEQDTLVAAIPGASLLVYPDAGHALHWEEPQRFAADLAAFIGGIVARDRRSAA